MDNRSMDEKQSTRKGIVVPFLPCLVAFWGFHPYMFFHFFKCFFVTYILRWTAMPESVFPSSKVNVPMTTSKETKLGKRGEHPGTPLWGKHC